MSRSVKKGPFVDKSLYKKVSEMNKSSTSDKKMIKTYSRCSTIIPEMVGASGTLFTISGNRQISVVKNGSFYNVDEGVEPHYILSKPESIYDRQGLVRYMQELK